MRALVTGAAGFVGSSLARELLAQGHDVRGVDCFTPYYPEKLKRRNVSPLLDSKSFSFVQADLREADLSPLVKDVGVIFHEAAQPGVRHSWSTGFADYESHNVLVTQRLLEAAKGVDELRRFVFASSSSVYGNGAGCPMSERELPRPHSPYGVTKLAAEHLCQLYAANWDVPTVSLRYFSIYGPGQRPDMAIAKLIEAVLLRQPFALFGDGRQVRDFTYVSDIVAGSLAAAFSDLVPGEVMNIGSGRSATVFDAIRMVECITGSVAHILRRPPQAGDVHRTCADIGRAASRLRWSPTVSLEEGLAAQVAERASRPL